VIVNPLRIKTEFLNELSNNLLLFNTKTSRLSSTIIEKQARNVSMNNSKTIKATHKLKEQAIMMKEALLKGDIDKVGEILDFGWENKKKMAPGITNSMIDQIYETAKNNGASGGKISGAGGGGFMIFYCPDDIRYKVIESLSKFGGANQRYDFTNSGLTSWKI